MEQCLQRSHLNSIFGQGIVIEQPSAEAERHSTVTPQELPQSLPLTRLGGSNQELLADGRVGHEPSIVAAGAGQVTLAFGTDSHWAS